MKGTLYFAGDEVEVDVTLPSLRFPAEPIELLDAPTRITGTGTLEGPLPDWLLEPEVYARKPLTERERALLYGDGSGRPLGILDGSAFYQEPTESDSRQRRRWIARKGRR